MHAPDVRDDRLSADPAWLRGVAALIGASVPGLTAVGAWWLGVPYVAAVAGVGIPIGAVLAACLATRALRPGWPLLIVVVALGAPLLVAAVLALAGSAEGPERLVIGFAFVAAYAVILGVPVTLPTVLVAVLLLRRAGRMSTHRAIRHASLLAATAAVTAIGTLAVALGPLDRAAEDAGIGPVDWAAMSAAVRLEVGIENRTTGEIAIDIVEDLGGGAFSGTSAWLGPCEARTERFDLESTRWTVRMGDPTGAAWGDGRVLASSSIAPGSDPRLLLVIGPGEAASAAPGAWLPREGPLAPESCG